MRKLFDLNGKTAIVTGANTGLGQGIALALAGAGAAISLVGRSAPDETVAQIEASGGKYCVIKADLSQLDDIDQIIKQSRAELGGADILVNNAGITRDQLFMRMSDEDWLTVLEVNLTATMRRCKGVLRGMMKSRWGRIVNISSVVGATGNPGQGNYAASKAGVAGMTLPVARDLSKSGIRVLTIAPGIFETPMLLGLSPDVQESLGQQVPFPSRLGKAHEYASLDRAI